MSQQIAYMELTHSDTRLVLKGDWIIGSLSEIDKTVQQLVLKNPIEQIDASNILALDTAGAYLIFCLQKKVLEDNATAALIGLKKNFQSLFDVVSQAIHAEKKQIIVPVKRDVFYRIGKSAVTLYQQSLLLMNFLGEVLTYALRVILKPARLPWKSVIYEIDIGGYRALPIVATMMFLIGIVVAYQLGMQLKIYGASIYIVDLSGIAILREFSPLISAVIIAGRTSTSFAALIGTMKVNEEIDALQTMGLSPIERLALPKIIALIIALPLLVMWGDLFGILGSLVMAKSMVGIGAKAFFTRFQQEVAVKHLLLGLVKTPIFALIIAGIGCYQGFQAEGSAQSVGERTTIAAVQAIFLIILADGLFSILFNWMDL